MKTTLIVAFALLALGCGGGDDTAETPLAAESDADESPDDSGEPAAEPPADESDGGDTDSGDADAADAGAGGSNVARFTVAGETFDFEWEAGALTRCDTDFFGGFWALASDSDGAGFEAEIWPDDAADPTQVSRIEVKAGPDGPDWTADPDKTIGQTIADWPAQVDSFEINGNTATGTATFVGPFAFDEEPEGVPGTFEITCNE